MKWIIKRITGIISFICASGWLCFALYNTLKNFPTDIEYIFTILSMICLGISTILYVILTRFGITEYKEIDKITSENQILKLQIKQKELRKKLTME
ncbi:MAG TPA: hypothetical protein VGK38_12585 [Prolixibacteraceae bacterium]|jgi:hypothetical protein